MSGNYKGKFDVVVNTVNKVVLKENASGLWSNEGELVDGKLKYDVKACYQWMLDVAKSQKAEFKPFTPNASASDLEPTVKSGRGDKPYMAMLSASDNFGASNKRTVTVFAPQ
jgi:hypothetical protein